MLAISFTLALASSRRTPTSVDPRRTPHLTGQSVVICGAVCGVIGTLETLWKLLYFVTRCPLSHQLCTVVFSLRDFWAVVAVAERQQ